VGHEQVFSSHACVHTFFFPSSCYPRPHPVSPLFSHHCAHSMHSLNHGPHSFFYEMNFSFFLCLHFSVLAFRSFFSLVDWPHLISRAASSLPHPPGFAFYFPPYVGRLFRCFFFCARSHTWLALFELCFFLPPTPREFPLPLSSTSYFSVVLTPTE